jgi:hypothetical protein
LSAQARLFLERFEAEVAHIHAVWDAAIAAPANGAAPVIGRARTRHEHNGAGSRSARRAAR